MSLTTKQRVEKIVKLTCKKHVKIYALNKIGLTNTEIAKALGTNTGHVYNALEMYKAKPSYRKAADEIGKNGGEVKRAVKKSSTKKEDRPKPTSAKVKSKAKPVIAKKKSKPSKEKVGATTTVLEHTEEPVVAELPEIKEEEVLLESATGSEAEEAED